MGLDTSCGICDKHYQSCRHFVKQHIPDGNKALCGRKKVLLLDENWLDVDTDPEDICENCKKRQIALMRDTPESWE